MCDTKNAFNLINKRWGWLSVWRKYYMMKIYLFHVQIYTLRICVTGLKCVFFFWFFFSQKRVYSKLKGMYTQFKYVWLKVNLAFYLRNFFILKKKDLLLNLKTTVNPFDDVYIPINFEISFTAFQYFFLQENYFNFNLKFMY